MSGYSLESSLDGTRWHAVTEKVGDLDCPAMGYRAAPVKRNRQQDIEREAEFHSHRYPYVRIVWERRR